VGDNSVTSLNPYHGDRMKFTLADMNPNLFESVCRFTLTTLLSNSKLEISRLLGRDERGKSSNVFTFKAQFKNHKYLRWNWNEGCIEFQTPKMRKLKKCISISPCVNAHGTALNHFLSTFVTCTTTRDEITDLWRGGIEFVWDKDPKSVDRYESALRLIDKYYQETVSDPMFAFITKNGGKYDR